ncbi:MAG: LutB/LldF family L-lactate oxidation iron-sulfur protein [Melioribacteraceae bacterium]
MPTQKLNIKKHVSDALADDNLRKAVYKATASTSASRINTTESIPYWEELRNKTHIIKKDVIENLDHYLELFEKNCLANGIKIHWAIDADEAKAIVLNIAKKNNVKTIVKSKSLTTEEIHLNELLIKNNIDTVETDLGEYIVQLNDQVPSHLIAPALHLSRNDIGKLFTEKLKTPFTDVPEELLLIARKRLREKFLSAEMSISGVNFAFAENGTFCVVENEANAHLSISLPKIHLALMGIEKLLPSLNELPYFLKLLAPSATGQKSSTYVNFIGGPSQKKYGEGPEEVHVILLDNGRSKILADPKLRETLYCIRCGACLNVCPVYQQIGGHAYNWVYMGPIGITLIPQYLSEIEGKDAPFLSSLCSACGDVCPVKIKLPQHILELRKKVVEKDQSRFFEKIIIKTWTYVSTKPKLYRFFGWSAKKIQMLVPIEFMKIPGYYKKRSFPGIDKKGFREQFYELNDSKNK